MTFRAILLFIGLVVAAPLQAQRGDEAAVTRLVDQFVAAQRDFDQATLARLTAPDYVEISPVGEVDPREKMLGFYSLDKKRPAPPLTLGERSVRFYDRVAVATARLSYGPASLRGVYVARRGPKGWTLVSAQFTPIREPRTSASRP